ncbi:MAG: Ig-like domain-containing protein [Candidatus Limnocylindria bacterium]
MRPLLHAVLALVCLAAALGLPTSTLAAGSVKVAIIVGPVGDLTPTYLAIAETAAHAAERHGGTVARAYSPHATPANVLAAVEGANVIIYFGHGYGHPSPYGGLNTARQNGWALQGPRAHGTHGDSLGGELAYYGEDWIVANARPAPGFVMIYSNTCYAPGASEGGDPVATPWVAARRVASYSRSVFEMGGSAYFATDFDRGGADLVSRLLANRSASYGNAFASDSRFLPWALTTQPHHFSAGQQLWLHRSKYTDGPSNYWYAFAGNPDLSPLRAWDRAAPRAALVAPVVGPVTDAVEVAPDVAVKVRFDEPVHWLTPAVLRLEDAAGSVIPGALAYDAASRTATLQPAKPLPLSARITVVLADGVTDAAGNRVAPVSWSLRTWTDADPLTDDLRLILEPGAHELVKLAPGGSIAERRELDAGASRFVRAAQRARLVGQDGSWFELAGDDLAGWWIAESADAHARGLTEEAILAPHASVPLPPGDRALYAMESGAPVVAGELATAVEQEAILDRRMVIDGRTYVRLADTVFVGRWIEVTPVAVPTEADSNRILSSNQRPSATLVLAGEGWTAFRFDATGRVTDRRALEAEALAGLHTSETLDVAGRRFHRIEDGRLAGWSLPDGPNLQVVPKAPPSTPRQ